MNWTLEYQGCIRTLADWGLSALKRRRLNQGRDTLSFIESGRSVDAPPLFAPETPVTIRCNDTVYFRGIVVRAPGIGQRACEARRYELAGPWWYLENLIFQQAWAEAVDVNNPDSLTEPVFKGRVILGQNAAGKPISLRDQVEEIITYASDLGAPIALGTIDPDLTFPMDETRDLTCAEALTRILRWAPDAVVWFDYSREENACLNVSTRKTMRDIMLPMGGVKAIELTPRHDLKVPAVVLKYEKKHVENGASWTTTERDAFPETATGGELKALVLTVELDGMRAQLLRQKVKVEAIHHEHPHWWQRHIPSLDGVRHLTIKQATRTSALPNELIEGSVAGWMRRQVEEDVVRALVSYETDDRSVVDREVTVRLNATDASTFTYQRLLSEEPDESAPFGLARQLYDAVNVLQYDGFVELESDEIEPQGFLGGLLSFSESTPEYAQMRAVIQEVRDDVDCGRTWIRFGPPKHLGADDLVELMRVNRRRRATRHASVRSSGRVDKQGGLLEQATHARLDNTDSGGGAYKRLVIVDPTNTERAIELDVASIPKDLRIALKQEMVCVNGELKARLVLASDPFWPDLIEVSSL
jgi:hypothetical protein